MFEKILRQIKILFYKAKLLFNDHRKSIPPEKFFSAIKESRNNIYSQDIDNIERLTIQEINNFLDTEQISSADRLMFHYKNYSREKKAIEAGFNTYVFRDDIDTFISQVSNAVVKIKELSNFERKIPENKIDTIIKARPLFDELYILYTDYTGREERKVEAEKRAKDPIVFGVFKSSDNKIWNHRFYFICDWIDEYCDLTLDKFVSQMSSFGYDKVVHDKKIDIEDVKRRLKDFKDDPKQHRLIIG